MADEEGRGGEDNLTKNYEYVLRESSLLTTVSVFLFGFLLNISLNRPKGFSFLMTSFLCLHFTL